MNRFDLALKTSLAPHRIDLPQLANAFDFAVRQTVAEGENPGNDPAVLLLGSFVAFHCHADVNTTGGYHQLLALCNDRLCNPKVMQ